MAASAINCTTLVSVDSCFRGLNVLEKIVNCKLNKQMKTKQTHIVMQSG